MADRRFTDVRELDPGAVRSLPADHPAMTENRTLFQKTVITVTETEPERLLVSGFNNRKLGAVVEKGKFRGYALFGLSLEERATCPIDCEVRGACYGNGMQFGRRHRIGDPDVFYDRLGFEIVKLIDDYPAGLLVRLHVLGDFPSVDYVAFWADALTENPLLACYGYSHRRPTSRGGDEIGDAIAALKAAQPDRFRIRWSSDAALPDGDAAHVIDYEPRLKRIDLGIVCPAQTEATACCATCGLCWEPAARHDSIVFIKHGPKSAEAALAAVNAAAAAPPVVRAAPPPQPVVMLPLRDMKPGQIAKHSVVSTPAVVAADLPRPRPAQIPSAAARPEPLPIVKQVLAPTVVPAPRAPAVIPVKPFVADPVEVSSRPIQGIAIPSAFPPKKDIGVAPQVRYVDPRQLRVEPSYQRDLTGRSITLIRRIVTAWDWAKFKAPIVVETPEGLFVIDGQHTAIAAASHPDIDVIPVMVVSAERLDQRADAFVAHNRDRLVMSPFQIFHAEVVAGNEEARAVMAAIIKGGGSVPRSMPVKGKAQVGQIIAIAEARRLYRGRGASYLQRLVGIAVAAGLTPVTVTALRGVAAVLSNPDMKDVAARPDAVIAAAMASIKNFETAAIQRGARMGQGKYQGSMAVIAEAVRARQ